MNSSIRTRPTASRSETTRRPVRHVVMETMMSAATRSGNQPPAGILNTLAPKNAKSMTASGMHRPSARALVHPQLLRVRK